MKKSSTDHTKGVSALILLAFLGSLMGVFARYLYTFFSVFQQIYLRFAFASLFGFLIFWKYISFAKIKKISPREWLIIGVRSFSYSVAAALWVQAVNSAKYANAMFIDSIPLAAVWGMILFKEKMTAKKAFYLILAIFGVMVLAVKDYSNLLIWGKGEVMMFLATVLFAFRNVTRKWHSKLLNNQEISQLNLLITCLMLFVISLILNEGSVSLSSLNWQVFVMLGMGALTLLFIVFLTNYGFDKIEAILASNIGTLGAVFGVLIGFIVYREVPTVKELLGGAIIVTSIIQMNRLKS